MFKFGADPELFVKKNGVFVSGYGMIPGDKENPMPVEHGAVQVDGMALEFNILPATTEQEFLFSLEQVMKKLASMVPDYELAISPVAEFTEEYLKQQPEKATELGCNPDYNAWTGEQNPMPDASVSFRTGSGHIHIGWSENEDLKSVEHTAMAFDAVKQLDFFLGLPSLFFDKDTRRRELYGKAGACRVKPYGVEYRVLSNQWLGSKSLMSWAFRSAKEGMERLVSGEYLPGIYGDIQDIINTSDQKRAKTLLKDAGIAIPV